MKRPRTLQGRSVHNRPILLVVAMALLLVATACAPQEGQTATGDSVAAQAPAGTAAEPETDTDTNTGTETETGTEAAAEDFDLDELIAAAAEEPEATIYNISGRVEENAEAFEAEYGIPVTGVKMGGTEQAERAIREVDSGNILGSAVSFEDGALINTELIPGNYVENWVPPDMVDTIPEEYQDPLVILWQTRIFGYNTEVYGDTCPIDNVWALTEDEWRGKFTIADPASNQAELDWFSKLVTDEADTLAQAYEGHYGEPLETDEENAAWEWIKRLAANGPIITQSGGDAADAVGAPGQDDPPMGFYTLGKHRDIEAAGLQLGMCEGLQPWMATAHPWYNLLVADAPSPNTAKLFTRFLLTPEGSAPYVADTLGAFSTNSDIPPNEDDPIGGLEDWREVAVFVGPEHNETAWEMRPTMRDFWLLNLP